VRGIPVSSIDTTLSAEWGTSSDGEVQGPVLVDEADLVRWLSAQFQTYPGCSTVSVERVIRLAKPDSDGCNWSRTLVLNPGGAPAEAYALAYAAIVDLGRKAFNLTPGEELTPSTDLPATASGRTEPPPSP
jgi:hypothetical protein